MGESEGGHQLSPVTVARAKSCRMIALTIIPQIPGMYWQAVGRDARINGDKRDVQRFP
jgi:hypothetical protein